MIAETTYSVSALTGQTIKAILWSPALVSGNLQAWNPTINSGAGGFDNITTGNWAQHLLAVAEPNSLGVYVLDLLSLSPLLPASGISLNCKFYNTNTPAAQPIVEFPTAFWNGTILAINSVNANFINAMIPTPETAADFEDVDITTTVVRS